MSNKDLRHAVENAMRQQHSVPPSSQRSEPQRYVPDQGMQQPPQAAVSSVGGVQNHSSSSKTGEKKQKNKTRSDKRLKAAGLIFIALFIASIFFAPSSASVTSSADASLALESGISTVLPLGTRLLADDQNLGGQDLTITHSSVADETKIHVWDYAAEDGDYVQVLVDGVPLGDPFMIYNKPVELTVPTIGDITILGTHDGGGGITYAIHYDVNGTTYYNGTEVGDGNVYTLIRE